MKEKILELILERIKQLDMENMYIVDTKSISELKELYNEILEM